MRMKPLTDETGEVRELTREDMQRFRLKEWVAQHGQGSERKGI